MNQNDFKNCSSFEKVTWESNKNTGTRKFSNAALCHPLFNIGLQIKYSGNIKTGYELISRMPPNTC